MFFFRLNFHHVCMILTFFLVSNTEVLTLRVATPLCVCGRQTTLSQGQRIRYLHYRS